MIHRDFIQLDFCCFKDPIDVFYLDHDPEGMWYELEWES